MKEIHQNITIGIFSILVFFISSLLFEEILIKLKIEDEYGFSNYRFLDWFFNVFYTRNGLYNEPNLYYFLLNLIIGIFITKILFKKFIFKISRK